MLLLALVPLLALTACHQQFGSVPHGGPAVGSGHPIAVDIRTAAHPGFDRVVFDFNGGVPAYFAEYVSANQLVGPSGTPVSVAGTYFLRVRFTGLTTAPAPLLRTPNLTEVKQVKQVKQVEDSEGVLIYGVGVSRRNAFRIFSLTAPDRVVLDVQR
ncbi:MAG TPA: hypothetical protein VLR26_10870 [Frankiaceae bacterium]|nr:hypothetical protein [Frankiaceae bacterium]